MQESSRKSVDQELIPHINYALVAKRHPPMYLMHRFRARKPHNVVAEYIEHYSRTGEVVLDPFVGSGPTAIEGLKLGRKVIAVDLDPLATFILSCTVKPVALKELENTFEKIKRKVKDNIYELYKVPCSNCGYEGAILTCTVYSFVVKCPHCQSNVTIADLLKREKAKEKRKQNVYPCPYCNKNFNLAQLKIEKIIPVYIQYKCEACKKEGVWTKVNDELLKILEETNKKETPFWYPNIKLYYPSKRFITKRRGESILDLFDKRNLIALSILYHEIEQLPQGIAKDLMKLAFSSSLEIVSRLNPFRPPRSTKSGWTVHEYWVPATHSLNNVWDSFEENYKDIRKGKEESNKEIPYCKEARNINELLTSDANILILTCSAIDLKRELCENCYKKKPCQGCIDYVFTDPPYGGAIQYFELDTFRLAWLIGEKGDPRFNIDWWEDEITINRSQSKDFNYYHTMLEKAFRNVYDSMKNEKYMTVTFHSTEVQIYNSIIRAAVHGGFALENIIYQTPAVKPAKAALHPFTSAVGDYYIRFRKPERPEEMLEERVDERAFRSVVVEAVKEIISLRGEPTSYTDLLKGIYVKLKARGFLLIAKPENIEKIIKEHEGKEFIFIKDKGWWFKEPSKYMLDIAPLQDRIEISVLQTLKREVKASFDDVLQEIFKSFPNALTPSPMSVRTVLEQYADRTKDGIWRLKPKVEEREKEHSEMIYYLAMLGNKAAYRVWIGLKEQSALYKGKPLSEFSERKLELPLPEENLKRIQNIDALWIKNGEITCEFEVENTTGFTEAIIIRGIRIPSLTTKRFLVVPEERRGALYKKIDEPYLKEAIEKYQWGFIFYDELKEFFKKNKRKRSIKIEDLEGLAETKIKTEKQKTLTEFA